MKIPFLQNKNSLKNSNFFSPDSAYCSAIVRLHRNLHYMMKKKEAVAHKTRIRRTKIGRRWRGNRDMNT